MDTPASATAGEAAREAAEGLLRAVLEAACVNAGLSLDSDADPGAPARNYELALRLGIGRVFGLVATEEPRVMRQAAPYPAELERLVEALRYRRDRGWKVFLRDDFTRDPADTHSGESRGLTLTVVREGPDSYHPERVMRVAHHFAVPPATFNRESWMDWLFDRLGDVDTHERMEDFALCVVGQSVRDGQTVPEQLERPRAPNHGPGWNPYLVTVVSTDLDRRTSFTGAVNGVDLNEKFTPEEGRSILAAIAADPELDRMVAKAITIRRASSQWEPSPE